jgi:hypothetical protein
VRATVAVGGRGEGPGGLRAPVGRRAGDRGGHLRFTDRAVDYGDEHVIELTDTAAEVYARTGRAEALAAALQVGALIPRPGADRS